MVSVVTGREANAGRHVLTCKPVGKECMMDERRSHIRYGGIGVVVFQMGTRSYIGVLKDISVG